MWQIIQPILPNISMGVHLISIVFICYLASKANRIKKFSEQSLSDYEKLIDLYKETSNKVLEQTSKSLEQIEDLSEEILDLSQDKEILTIQLETTFQILTERLALSSGRDTEDLRKEMVEFIDIIVDDKLAEAFSDYKEVEQENGTTEI